jgi:hypothetical protein
MSHKLTNDVERLISENGLKAVIGALARYCNSPSYQHYSVATMATVFRRLNKLFEYLEEKVERAE